MADRAVQYALWHPQYEVSGSRLTCLVDVVPWTDALLGDGDSELFEHFAEQLGMGSALRVEWSVKAFNTPFYSYNIDADEFNDWMTPAWRLCLAVDNWSGPAPAEPISPVPAWGYDKSWY